MSTLSSPPRPLRISIGELRIRGGSGLAARGLADALPAALARALDPGPAPRRAPSDAADHAARQIADRIVAAVEKGQ